MNMNEPESSFDGQKGPRSFATTHWSVVLAAGQNSSPETTEALGKLYCAYSYPLYVYVRRKGHGMHDAQDLTQEFFTMLLTKHSLRGVHPDKGKFRSFLLAAMNHFLAKEWRRDQAQKRGGGCGCFSLDAASAESRYQLEPVDKQSPEKIFDRRWALTLLHRAMAQLKDDCFSVGKAALFEQLKGMLGGEKSQNRYADAAERLGMKEATARKAVQRLRERYREFLRAEVAQTVSKPEEVDEEIHYLFSALRS